MFAILRKMKPLRQIEAAEMMISASRLSVPYAKMILAASRPNMLIEVKKPRQLDATPEDITRMERPMEKLYLGDKAIEATLGETLLVLVVAKGFVIRPLRNNAISEYLNRCHQDLTGELATVMEAIGADARMPVRE